ncbi:ATP-grasp fold amidoligase family protein [Clostridium perfringens]|uniref:ATP-grasp fold amidoligase family protein n=1 Tax=Clostridium perfringens TaxID=1502 RepID=UPI0022E3B0FE|nr:ATP-grasp fold amidoligase family protein [Clostridium perfringens]
MDINITARIIRKLGFKGFLSWMPDNIYLKYVYRDIIGENLNLKKPQGFNEKLQWLKLYDRNPEYTNMVDKYEAKKYVAKKIGDSYIIPTLGIWDKFEDIDFDNLPNQFVLKCTHDSGGVIICHDKKDFDIENARKKINSKLRKNFYYSGREWPYKNIKPRIIAEKLMINNSICKSNNVEAQEISQEYNNELLDYKFMCFDGKVKCSFVCSERFSSDGLKVTFFDKDWNILEFERHYPKSKIQIPKPSKYYDMIKIAEKLSKGIPFVRVDLYESNEKVYFGELTFYPGSGFEEFSPKSADINLGSWIKLPKKSMYNK